MLFVDPTFHLVALGAPLLALWVGFALTRRRHDAHSRLLLAEAEAEGLNEPSSLHPFIDPMRCVGCGACTQVCPEGEVLGLIDNRAVLVQPSKCIGHGACKAACPHDAITLVFGTARRGVDVPSLSSNFESSVPGLFIAGELGGMGLIANAIEQGVAAVSSVAELPGLMRWHERYDVVIVGAGPAGIAASLRAREVGLSALTLEQDTLGGTVAHYPRGKVVMMRPAVLPLVGEVHFRETRKESLLLHWESILARFPMPMHFDERVENISTERDGFIVTTERGRYPTRAVVLAIGRRGSPRKLGVPGEALPKVVYRLADADQYRGQHVLVVGGGDSALEAAVSLVEEGGCASVSLSYRGKALLRAKAGNRERAAALSRAGRLVLALRSQVQTIYPGSVDLMIGGQAHSWLNDAVIVCAGGDLPTPFLREMGVEFVTKFGEP